MEKLGIEPVQLLTQIVNFVIMVTLLTKFLYKPIIKVLEERRKKIAEGLEYAEKMKEETEKMEKKRLETVNKAKDEARRIIEEAKKSGKQLENEIIQKAHEEEHAIIEKGKRDTELMRVDMEKNLKEKTIDIAQAMIARILAEALTQKDQQAIVNKKIQLIVKRLNQL